jgi:hypothetical protein
VKRLTFAAFIAFWAFIATLLALAALEPDGAHAGGVQGGNAYSPADVARHDDRDSCWMAIEGRIYDVTSHVALHPTPASVLLDWCGRDATVGMRTKGHGRDHSPAAWAQLDPLLIGALEGKFEQEMR